MERKPLKGTGQTMSPQHVTDFVSLLLKLSGLKVILPFIRDNGGFQIFLTDNKPMMMPEKEDSHKFTWVRMFTRVVKWKSDITTISGY